MKAVVLHGEVSGDAGRDEQDVLVQAGHVSRSLAEQGYEPTVIAVSADFSRLIDHLNILQPDFAFNLVESIMGQGRSPTRARGPRRSLRPPRSSLQNDSCG
jgi:hypothetical protein